MRIRGVTTDVNPCLFCENCYFETNSFGQPFQLIGLVNSITILVFYYLINYRMRLF